jgi:elongator complex protein 3
MSALPQARGDLARHALTHDGPGEMVQDGERQHPVEFPRIGFRENLGGQIALLEADPGRAFVCARAIDKRAAAVDSEIATAMTSCLERSRHAAESTTRVQDGILCRYALQDAQHPRLQARAGLGEGVGVPLVEFAIDAQQSLDHVNVHAAIIRPDPECIENAGIGAISCAADRLPLPPKLTETLRREAWIARRTASPEVIAQAVRVLEEVRGGLSVRQAQIRHPAPDGRLIPKSVLIQAYRALVQDGEWEESPEILRRIRMKPVRTLSGVATVTVLTKPHPCPGDCIYCPSEPRMPKSYLSDEPGAMRGVQHDFDPFGQTASRLEALRAIGHPVDKVELLILGGTWSSYPEDYQRWFVRRCLDACNGRGAESLDLAQRDNETGPSRNVGLVVETRPDLIDHAELSRLRRLGVTKVQLGVQSLDDDLLRRNRRGHTADQTRQAMALLRAAGIKIAVHWMPNLLGATPESDRQDFARLWSDEGLRPDELKIYPCQLLRGTDLYLAWERGEYTPYSQETLLALLADIKTTIPDYCRVNRVLRDIPAHHIVAGNTRSSLRQDVRDELQRRGQRCRCIRCREIREASVDAEGLSARVLTNWPDTPGCPSPARTRRTPG